MSVFLQEAQWSIWGQKVVTAIYSNHLNKRLSEANVAKQSSHDRRDRMWGLAVQFFRLAHTFANGQTPNSSGRLLLIYLFFTHRAIALLCWCCPCFQVRRLNVSIKGVVFSQLEMHDRGCRSVSASLVLNCSSVLFMEGREDTFIEKKSGTKKQNKKNNKPNKMQHWHRSRKKMPRWESKASIRWWFVFFCFFGFFSFGKLQT